MALIEVNWNPTPKDLRSFGKIALIATCILAALLYVIKDLAIQWLFVIITLGLVIFISSLISLKITRLIYITLTAVTLPIGMAVSFIVMAVFYYLIITPLGLLFRIIGRDSMKRGFDSNAQSYWVKHRPNKNLERYFHQF
jgi:cellulose synthase/poly-beta-1,6-N-acetylglucosamine synthase-like glycosyltransferase